MWELRVTNPAAIPYFVIGSRIAPTHLLGWHVWLQGSSPCVKDGLGAALGIVGVAVPSDVHCEAITRSEITVDRECLEREFGQGVFGQGVFWPWQVNVSYRTRTEWNIFVINVLKKNEKAQKDCMEYVS